MAKVSCHYNDENMLIIRGNKRVADIYFGEFLQFYKHYSFRDFVASGTAARLEVSPQYLDEENQCWRKHLGKTPLSRQRQYFARV